MKMLLCTCSLLVSQFVIAGPELPRPPALELAGWENQGVAGLATGGEPRDPLVFEKGQTEVPPPTGDNGPTDITRPVPPKDKTQEKITIRFVDKTTDSQDRPQQ